MCITENGVKGATKTYILLSVQFYWNGNNAKVQYFIRSNGRYYNVRSISGILRLLHSIYMSLNMFQLAKEKTESHSMKGILL